MPVDTKTQSVLDAEESLKIVEALWGGTRTMRDAGKDYLPQEPGEAKRDYENRRDRSVLTNAFKKTINTYVGRIFEDKVEIDDASFNDFSENVDMEGRSFHRFSYDLSKYALRDGLRFILVEAPVADGVKTRADESKAGIRPYFVEVDRRKYLGAIVEVIGSQKTIVQFRMLETVFEGGDEFTQVAIEQIRVIEPNQVRIYRKNDKGDWLLHETIVTSIDFVPVVPVYTDRSDHLESSPPLMDLAWLNIEHWQKSSDHNNILHVARVPILHWAGYKPVLDAEGSEIDLTIGPNTLAKSTDPQATLTYTEIQGDGALEMGMKDTGALEARMVSAGAEFTAPKKSGDITATEKAIDESGDISELSAFAQNLKDSLINALDMVAKMQGQTFNGDITMKTDLGIVITPVSIEQVVKIRAMGDISLEGMYSVLNTEWDTNLDAEEEAGRMSVEQPSLVKEPAGIDDDS